VIEGSRPRRREQRLLHEIILAEFGLTGLPEGLKAATGSASGERNVVTTPPCRR